MSLASGERPPTDALLDRALRAAYTAGPKVRVGASRDATLPSEHTCRVENEIARGGMGIVYRAHDPSLGRDVALKILREELADDAAAVRRFLEEARIGGRLQHPGVVPVYALGRTQTGRPWFTMKLIEGRTFASMLAERVSPARDLRRFLAVFESICRTMAFAHDRGVVHLDLKPGNVMVGAFGEVQVVDWGLAALARSSDRSAEPRLDERSRTGAVYGTPAYMPPEQARGESARIDERADVFALGAMLCEILTGSPPYPGGREASRSDAADARLEGARERLRTADTPDLAALCAECLAPEPQERRTSASEIAARVAQYFATLEERARAAEVAAAEARTRAAEERRARRLTIALAVSVVLSIVVGFSFWAWLSSERASRRKAVDARASLAIEEAARFLGSAESSADASTYDRAEVAAVRAQSALAGGDGSPSLAASAAALLERIRSEGAAARTRSERERAVRALLARLDELRVPDDDRDPLAMDRAYSAAFQAAGLDVDSTSPDEFGRRVQAREVAVEVAAALDEWSDVRESACLLARADALRRLALSVDPDPTRSRVRRAIACGGLEDLERALDNTDLSALRPGTIHALGRRIPAAFPERAPERIADLYRAAHEAHPDDPTIAIELARTLFVQGAPAQGEHFYRLAIALRPKDTTAYLELGWELEHLGLDPVAAAELDLRAIELGDRDDALSAKPDPTFRAYFVLGRALRVLTDLDGAVAAQQEAARHAPGDMRPHKELAMLHRMAGLREKALEEFRAVVAAAPGYAVARHEFADALAESGRTEEALEQLRQILPTDDQDRSRLKSREAAILLASGDYAQAVRVLRGIAPVKSVEVLPLFEHGARLQDFFDLEAVHEDCERQVGFLPTNPEMLCALGAVQEARGRYGQAFVAFRAGDRFGSQQPGWHRPSAAWARRAEHLASVEERLMEAAAGQGAPRDADDAFDFGLVASRKGLFELAARWFSECFERDPSRASIGLARLEASAAAAQAGRPDDTTAASGSERLRARWRERALAWLREDLAERRAQIESGGPAAMEARRALDAWLVASELECVRCAARIAELPEAERAAWRAAWEMASELSAKARRAEDR